MSKEYFKITTSYCSYYAEIWHQYPNIDKVYFGGKRKCATFSIYFDEPDPNLDALGYSENCNISGDMYRQQGTNHMILTAFAFIHQTYSKKNVSQNFLLRDSSYINCQSYSMSLANYCVMHYNKTWYEKHFKAFPTFDKDLYQTSMSAWKKMKKTKPDLSKYFAAVKNKKRQQVLRDTYEKSDTFEGFIQQLKSFDCLIYKDWNESFINTYVNNLNGMSWTVDASQLLLPEIQVDYIGKDKPYDMFIHTGGTMSNFIDASYIR